MVSFDAATIEPTVTGESTRVQSVGIHEMIVAPTPTKTRSGLQGVRAAPRSKGPASTYAFIGPATTAGCRIFKRPPRRQRPSRPPHVKALVVPVAGVSRAAIALGLDAISPRGIGMARRRLLVCLAMNRTSSKATRSAPPVQPELQGTAGQSDRSHLADEPGNGVRRRRSPAKWWTPTAGEEVARVILPSSLSTRRACHCVATISTQTDHAGAIPARGHFEAWRDHLFEDDRATDPAHPSGNPICRWQRAGRQQQLRLWLVARACATGIGPYCIKAPSANVLRDLSWGFIGARAAVVTADHASIDALQSLLEREPQTIVDVRVDTGVVTAGALPSRHTMPSGMRDAFRTDQWNPTAMLLPISIGSELWQPRSLSLRVS